MRNGFWIALLAAGLAAGQTHSLPVSDPGSLPSRNRKGAVSIPSYNQLKYPPLAAVKIPEIVTFTLSNGMKVYLLENRELPLIGGFALIRTGNLFEPADKVGLAQIAGSVLRSGGTRTKTGDQLDEQLENIAASVESSIGESSGTMSFNALKENADEVLAVFQDLLTEPEFRQDKIDLLKTQLRGSIARRNDEASGIAGREFNDLLYGRDTPYGRRLEYEHLERIQRDDLIAFYKRYYFPANIRLAIQGDFSAPEMKAKIEKVLGSWNYTQPPVPAFPPVTAKPVPGVFLAAKEDVTQSFLRVGHLGGTLRDKNYPALEVMTDILGSGFSSRLFKRVRTELGWAYNVGASWGAGYDHPGLFTVSGSTKSASTTETVRVIREEIEKIRGAEVTDQELKTAKDTVLNGFVFNFDRPSKTLSRLVTYDYHGFPKDFIFQYQKAVAAVTKADVLRVAKEYLKPESLSVVAVGKPKDFGAPLGELGLKVEQIDLTIPEPKRPAAQSDAATQARGRQMLERAQQALGGAAKLAAVKDYTQVAEAQLQMAGNTLKAKQTNRWMASGHFRQEQELPFGKMTVYSDGQSGWMVTPQGSGPMPEAVVKQVRGEMLRNLFKALLSDTANAAGETQIEISDQAGNRVRFELDAAGLPVKRLYSGMSPAGPVEIVETLSDWREVDGVRLPHKVAITQGGKPAADVTIQQWKLNGGLT
ncbi:MAG: insulinase family protein, partial [Acidobacteria bacterium]|nr:insulinase family protein [Acidobacteriota bacterium]